MLTQQDTCQTCTQACPLIQNQGHATVHTCVTSKIIKDGPRRVMILGHAPHHFNKEPFDGKLAGRMLYNLIDQHAYDEIGISLGYVLKCSPLDATFQPRDSSLAELDYCRTLLLREIEIYQPHAILCLGLRALRTFFPQLPKVSVMELRGTVRYDSPFVPDMPVYCSIDPHSIHEKKGAHSYAAVLRADLMRVFSKVAYPDVFAKYREKMTKWHIIKDPVYLEQLVDWLIENNVRIAYDTETSGLLKYENEMYVFSMCFDGETGYAIPVDLPSRNRGIDPDLTTPEWYERTLPEIKRVLKKLMESPIEKIAHNSIFDNGIMLQCLDVNPYDSNVVDTAFYAALLEEEFMDKYIPQTSVKRWRRLSTHGMHWLDYNDPAWGQDKGKRENIADSMVYLELMHYACVDAVVTYRIAFPLEKALYQKDPANYSKVSRELILRNAQLVTRVSYHGMPINVDLITALLDPNYEGEEGFTPLMKIVEEKEAAWQNHPEVMEARRSKHKQQDRKFLFAEFNTDAFLPKFNINSNPDLAYIYYTFHNLKYDNGQNGKIAVDSDFIEFFEDQMESIKILGEYKKAAKLCSTFFPGLLKNAMRYSDRRVRGSYRVDLTTGRTGSNDPNMQNMPRAGEGDDTKSWVKRCIESQDRSRVLVGTDYSSLEVRMAGIVAQDPTMRKVFWDAYALQQEFLQNPSTERWRKFKLQGDTHRNTASLMFKIPAEEITSAQRSAAKTLAFLCLYAANPAPQLSMKLKVSMDEAKDLLNKYLGSFKRLREWMLEVREFAVQHGYVKTIFDRRRNIYGVYCREDTYAFKHGMNLAVNVSVQSPGSDFSLAGAHAVDQYYENNQLGSKLINLVHDAVYTDMPIVELGHLFNVHSLLQRPPWLVEIDFPVDFIPMVAESEIGFNLADVAHWNGTPEHLQEIYAWLSAGGAGDPPPNPYA